MSWQGQQPYQGGGYNQPAYNPYGGAQGGYGAPPTQQQRHPPPAFAPGYGVPGQAPGYGAPPPIQPHGHAYHQQHAPPPRAYGAPPPPGGGGYGYGPHGQGPPPGVSQELWGWFQAVDADHSGKITAEELRLALLNGNSTPFNQESCRLMIGMFDSNKDGTINIQEFASLWKYVQDWKACFDRFDTDRSGNINIQELSDAFRTFGYNLSMNFSQLCIRVFDRQRRGAINFDDFIQCCVMLKTLTDKFRERDSQMKGQISVAYEDFLRMVLDTGVTI